MDENKKRKNKIISKQKEKIVKEVKKKRIQKG